MQRDTFSRAPTAAVPAASGARCAAQYARDGKDLKLLVDPRRVWARGDDSRPWLEAETGNDAAAAAGFAAAAAARGYYTHRCAHRANERTKT